MKRYTTIKEQVEYGLDTIDPSRTAVVNLRDLMYLHAVCGIAVNYFHQQMHYPDIESIHEFVGKKDTGGFLDVVSKAYYVRSRDMFPEDIENSFGDGRFDNPDPPFYYKPKSSNKE